VPDSQDANAGTERAANANVRPQRTDGPARPEGCTTAPKSGQVEVGAGVRQPTATPCPFSRGAHFLGDGTRFSVVTLPADWMILLRMNEQAHEQAWIPVNSCLGPESEGPATLEYLDSIGVSRTDVRLVVASHWHDDHDRGLAKLFSTPSARLASPPRRSGSKPGRRRSARLPPARPQLSSSY
jgi:glyoxylase-like metal-dependent hydrolase (beta-lactamase superfamily II)